MRRKKPTIPPEYAEQVKVYRAIRHECLEVINRRASEMVIDDTKVFKDWARLFEMLDGDVLGTESEHELTILIDAIIHGHRHKGKKIVIERLREELRPAPGSLTAEILDGMAASRYRVLLPLRAVRGVGLTVRDICSSEELFLFDKNMSLSIREGVEEEKRWGLAGWIYEVRGIMMTTGASMIVPEVLGIGLDEESRQLLANDEEFNAQGAMALTSILVSEGLASYMDCR